MINKEVASCADAVGEIFDGAAVMVGGFGEAGSPVELLHALIDHGARNLTVVSNNAGNGYVGLAALINNRQVRKLICTFPKGSHATVFAELYRRREVELEIVPQGTLAERIRAAGSGIAAFYTRTAAGTVLAREKECREFDGQSYVMEKALAADFALIKCELADSTGNLTFNKTARNFAPIMCQAAARTFVQARKIVPPGGIDPEHVVTPGIFVDAVIEVAEPAQERTLIEQGVHYP